MSMTSDPQPKRSESVRVEQLSLQLPGTEPDQENCESVNEIAEVPLEVQQRLEVIQQVMAVRGSEQYTKVQRQAARKLGLSV